MSFLTGFIAIVGPPNVGKSTFLNRILGSKLAIVSRKPQTTRNRIVGILHGNGYQMVFIDTPGIHKTRTALHQSMVKSALATFKEVDIILFMIEMGRPDDPEIAPIIGNIKKTGKPCVLVINKIDTGPKEQLLPIMDKYRKWHPFDAMSAVSALTGDGINTVIDELKSHLVPGPPFFPEDMNTELSESFLASEIIREKIFRLTRKEIPYSCAVTTDKMKEIKGKNLLFTAATIHVETDSQKGILIGKRGGMIKNISRSARLELEKVFGIPMYLDLKVKVEKNWTKNTKALDRLGY